MLQSDLDICGVSVRLTYAGIDTKLITVRAPISKFWDPLNISQTEKATIFKLGTHIGRGQFLPMDHKLAPKLAWPGVRDPISKFWDPLNISQTGKESYDLQIWHAHRPWAVLAPGP